MNYTLHNLFSEADSKFSNTGWTASGRTGYSSNFYRSERYSLRFNPQSGTATVRDTADSKLPLIIGHKYYCRFYALNTFTEIDVPFGIDVLFPADNTTPVMSATLPLNDSNWNAHSGLWTATGETAYSEFRLLLQNYPNVSGSGSGDASQYVFVDDIMLIDLTDDFGAGYEPSKEWLDANLDFFTVSTTLTVGMAVVNYNNANIVNELMQQPISVTYDSEIASLSVGDSKTLLCAQNIAAYVIEVGNTIKQKILQCANKVLATNIVVSLNDIIPPTPEQMTIEITSTGDEDYSYVIIDGVAYTSAATVTTNKGSIITCYAHNNYSSSSDSYVELNGTEIAKGTRARYPLDTALYTNISISLEHNSYQAYLLRRHYGKVHITAS